MKNANRWLDGLAWIGILAFAAAIGLGILVPVYVDEIATKLVQARFLAEHGQMLSLFPQCSSGFVLCSDQPKWRYLSPHRFVCEQHTPMFKGEVLDLADLF